MSRPDVPTEPPPPAAPRKPAFPDEDDERCAIGDAWEVMMDPRKDDDVVDGPITGLLFSAVSLVYEEAEGDPPVFGVLHAIRSTVEGWAHNHGESTLYSSVSFADLSLMLRRIDVVVALVRSDARARRREGGAA